MTKINKKKQCCVRMPEELHRWVKTNAYKYGLSLQTYICLLVEQAKRDYEEKNDGK